MLRPSATPAKDVPPSVSMNTARNTVPGGTSAPSSPGVAQPLFAQQPTNKKIPAIIHGGILGSVKQHIFTKLLDAVGGQHNILVCDRVGAEILSTCIRMHDLMDHGVTLVEDLALPRQPVRSSAAIYLVTPSDESCRFIMNDWAVKPMYREAHVFFTSPSPDRLIQMMATESRLVESLRTMKDLLLDYAAPEPLLFHLRMVSSLQKLFPPDVALSGGRENILGQIATRLISVFFTIGDGVPLVRYQGSSRLSQQVARLFAEQVSTMVRGTNCFATNDPSAEPPLLILVDRSFDAVEPLLHERSYQCLLNDLTPLTDGLYEQSFVSQSGQETKRRCPIDELDPYWCMYRHQFFQTCLEELPKKLQELIKENPSLSAGMDRGGSSGNKMAELGSAIRALPEFQEKKAKLSMHIDICTKIMDQYKQQKLMDVCEVEQDMATSRRPFKEVYESVRRLAADVAIPLNARVRLMLLLIATTNSREFTEAKKLLLLQEVGLGTESGRCNALNLFISRVGQLPQNDVATASSSGTCDSPSDIKDTLGNLMRRSLRTRPNRSTTTPAAPNPGVIQTSPGSGRDTFRNQAYLILSAAANNTLSPADFPWFNTTVDGLGGATSTNPSRRTLRSGLGRGTNDSAAVGAGGGPAATVTNRESNVVLDLGHEGQVSLRSKRRIVLFILGGATYGEARAAYEVAQAARTETIIGSTSMVTPDFFLSDLTFLN